ncbi:hypothetical protein VNO77_47112 [Canavalia gladiata]|uniref:Uncharacterized protein n=1 Tax=Canavalia gladiata TaxID=3824 RepID=A0AAN9JHG6_CANGL
MRAGFGSKGHRGRVKKENRSIFPGRALRSFLFINRKSRQTGHYDDAQISINALKERDCQPLGSRERTKAAKLVLISLICTGLVPECGTKGLGLISDLAGLSTRPFAIKKKEKRDTVLLVLTGTEWPASQSPYSIERIPSPSPGFDPSLSTELRKMELRNSYFRKKSYIPPKGYLIVSPRISLPKIDGTGSAGSKHFFLTLATNYSPVHIGKTTTETGTQRPPTVTSTPGKAEALLGLRTIKTSLTLAFDLEPADLTDGLALPTSMQMPGKHVEKTVEKAFRGAVFIQLEISVPHRDVDGLARSGSSSMIDSTLVFK